MTFEERLEHLKKGISFEEPKNLGGYQKPSEKARNSHFAAAAPPWRLAHNRLLKGQAPKVVIKK